MWGTDQQDLRQVWFSAWQKGRSNLPMNHLEQQLWQILQAHPEYADSFSENRAKQPDQATNEAFLHLALHQCIEEMIALDRPAGIVTRYQLLLHRLGHRHLALHHMMGCLFECWQELSSSDDLQMIETRLLCLLDE